MSPHDHSTHTLAMLAVDLNAIAYGGLAGWRPDYRGGRLVGPMGAVVGRGEAEAAVMGRGKRGKAAVKLETETVELKEA